MTQTNLIESTSHPAGRRSGLTAWHIRFVPEVPAGVRLLCQFIDHASFAVAESVDPFALIAKANWPEPTIQLEVLGAIAEFAFYEGELRRLGEAVLPFETSAIVDAPDAWRITSDTNENWARFGEKMEAIAQLRLTFGRLEPRLLTPSRSLPVNSRRLITQLSRRTAIKARLSAVSYRLEVCENLYEGAVDRITDHRWYRKGNLLELIIVLLLLIEVLLLAGDMAMRWTRDHF